MADPRQLAAALSAFSNPIGLNTGGVRYNSNGIKGNGYFGALPNANGDVSTELSGETGIGEFPLISPALSREQLARLLKNDSNIDDIYAASEGWAKQRIKNGQSPFISQYGELRATPGMLEY